MRAYSTENGVEKERILIGRVIRMVEVQHHLGILIVRVYRVNRERLGCLSEFVPGRVNSRTTY